MARPIYAEFVAGEHGEWRIEHLTPVSGSTLAPAPRLGITLGSSPQTGGAVWCLRGTTGHQRYTETSEARQLTTVQEGLGRPTATRAALIPIRKSETWWDLAQDERRAIFEASSRHIAIGLEYLPAVARRLYHCRELTEPFDFLTWFEYAPENAAAFEELVARLRQTEEWKYVDREVDIRLSRA